MSASGRIAFIGGGNMTQSLVAGLLKAGRPAGDLAVADPDPARRESLRRFAGATITADNAAAVAGAALVVLAVKPRAACAALASIAAPLRRARPVLLSTVAGLRITSILEAVGGDLPVVRAMPNTPASVGRSATLWYAHPATDTARRELARAVLDTVGLAIEVAEETHLDAATGLAGSGPAYFFLLVEALADAGVALGLPADTAARLAAATGVGAMTLLERSGETPAQLRERVTSPGGTTAAALAVLTGGDFRELVAHAVAAAAARARELGGDRSA